MKPSFPRALGLIALAAALPAWADNISYPADAALLRPIAGFAVISFAPSGTDTFPPISDSLSGNTVTVESADPVYVFGAINNADSTEVGGSGAGEGNLVRINVDLGANTYVFGGYSSGAADVTGNRVEITGAAIEADGGHVQAGTSNANANSVLVDGGSVWNVSGGFIGTGSGAATGNMVEIRNGAFVSGAVYGSEAGAGATTGNSVSILDSEVVGNITGGDTYGSASATNNTVSIGGSSTLGATSVIQGGSSSGDAFTGNTLKLENYTGTVGVSQVIDPASRSMKS
ncbi:MAG: hypothetical protein FWD77_11335 [Betaproteobacteria bacterium]|nr:hypothetical protein [Betaproteobacteria bacterium]